MGGSYQSYKIDTEIVTSWISTTARDLKYKPAPDPQSKGQPGKRTSKKTVGTRELLAQARFLANIGRPKVQVSIAIKNAISRAIAKRKRFYEFYKGHMDTTPADHTSTSQHRYFISTLVEIFELLSSCFVEVVEGDRTGADSAEGLLALEVEEIDLDDYEKLESAHASPFSNSKSQTQSGKVELDSEADEDHFKLYCFFQDLHDYQQYIIGMWEDFDLEYLDLITAGLASDIVLAIVHNANETLVSQHSAIIKSKTSFEDMKQLMLAGTTSSDGDVEEYTSKWIYDQAYHLVSNLGLLNTGTTYASRLSRIISDDERLSKEERLVAHFMLDAYSMKASVANQRQYRNPLVFGPQIDPAWELPTYTAAIDVATQSFEGLFKKPRNKTSVNVSTAFNCQILLSINETLGKKISTCYDELRKRGSVAANILDVMWDDNGFPNIEYTRGQTMGLLSELIPSRRVALQYLKRRWPRGSSARRVVDVSHFINSIIKHPDVVSFKQSELMKHLQTGTLSQPIDSSNGPQSQIPSPCHDPTFTINSNPIYCGKEALRLQLEMEALGVELVNACPSFIVIAHFYNAAKQARYLKSEWKAMDRAITTHVEQPFRGQLPTKPVEMMHRYGSKLGLPLKGFLKNSRPLQKHDFGGAAAKLDSAMKRNEYSEPLERYIAGVDSAERLLYNLCPPSRKGASARAPPPTYLDMVKQLTEKLPHILKDLETDYISLTGLSTKLLDRIYAKLSSEEHKEVEKAFTQPLSSGHIWLGTVLFLDYRSIANRGSNYKFGVDHVGTRFCTAANILNNFIDEANEVADSEPFDVVKETRDEELARRLSTSS